MKFSYREVNGKYVLTNGNGYFAVPVNKIAQFADMINGILATLPICDACSGHGMIGGLLPGDGGYDAVQCCQCDGSGREIPS